MVNSVLKSNNIFKGSHSPQVVWPFTPASMDHWFIPGIGVVRSNNNSPRLISDDNVLVGKESSLLSIINVSVVFYKVHVTGRPCVLEIHAVYLQGFFFNIIQHTFPVVPRNSRFNFLHIFFDIKTGVFIYFLKELFVSFKNTVSEVGVLERIGGR